MEKYKEIERSIITTYRSRLWSKFTRAIREYKLVKENDKICVCISGGKDSTATADVVIKALSNPSLVHIFGDTTLEFPSTMDYAMRYWDDHPQAIFQIAKNNEQDFYDVCEDIGPPARMMRWCCSMFKTGPITRVINNLYRNQQILTFYGIRKSESVSRSKYNRIEDDAESVKIQQQTVASPIFFWKDLDIWIYILSEGIDFNDAYRLGYDRVGCWCCPNNNQRAQFLSRIYMPEQSIAAFLVIYRDVLLREELSQFLKNFAENTRRKRAVRRLGHTVALGSVKADEIISFFVTADGVLRFVTIALFTWRADERGNLHLVKTVLLENLSYRFTLKLLFVIVGKALVCAATAKRVVTSAPDTPIRVGNKPLGATHRVGAANLYYLDFHHVTWHSTADKNHLAVDFCHAKAEIRYINNLRRKHVIFL